MNPTRGVANLLLSSTVLVGVWYGSAQAQIAPAGNDANTVVTRSSNTFDITGGTTTGTNLFHSFQTFGLNADQIANFRANPATQNILGRVVGGDASIINGLLRVIGSNANLYLMNPAGIVFGANARLDVAGSFTATTATGMGFGTRWFNAIGSNDYAALLGNPDRFAFTVTQPGAIVNAGTLTVGANQNLLLLGGTVVNTGQLIAPAGQLIAAAVPGQKLVRLSQSGSLLSFEIAPLPPKVPRPDPGAVPPAPTPLPNAWTLPIATLPALLTGGSGGNAMGLSVDAAGTVTLTGSGIPVEVGDVVARTVTAGTATLSAAHNLTLVESQLRTTGNLSLLAANAVQLRDSAASPAILQAGNKLLIQGNTIDLAALHHPGSGVFSGGDTVLRSANPIRSDVHYVTGGSLTLENLNGNANSLFSLDDPVILAQGDVTLGDYTGPSLHILAGGSVTLGAVTITNVDTTANTINPANPNPFLASLALRNITRADGSPLYVNVTPTLDSAGNVQRLPQASDQLMIDGSANPTLDVRAGINWAALGGVPGQPFFPNPFPPGTATTGPTLTTPPTSANITINQIQVNRVGMGADDPAAKPAVVLLTNQYKPNLTLTGGAIQVNGVIQLSAAGSNTPSNLTVIDSRGSITTTNITLRNGSADLTAVGNITTGSITAAGLDFVGSDSIVLRSLTGNIQVTTIDGGANGVDVRAAGLFRAIGSKSFIDFDPFPGLPRAGTELGDFLIGKGFSPNPNTVIRIRFINDRPGVSVGSRPVSRSAGVLNAPITIQYGDGSTVIANQTFPIFSPFGGDPTTASVGRLMIKGGGAAFYSGSTSNAVIPGAGSFIESNGAGGYRAVASPPAPLPTDLFQNTQNFQDRSFPVDASGTVGVLAIGSGSDASFYGSTQNLQFTPIVAPSIVEPPVVEPNRGGGFYVSVQSLQFTSIVERLGDGGQFAQQLTQQRSGSACTPTGTIATAPGETSSTGYRSSSRVSSAATAPTAITNPCGNANDDTQILQILDSAPQP